MATRRGIVPGLIALAVAGGCASEITTIEPIRHATGMADAQAAARYIRSPRPDRFSVCHEHTCRVISAISLAPADWESVQRVFTPPARDAAAEREQIAGAIALLERLVGAHIGTGKDLGRNFPGLGLEGQMDCVDEATNTSAYILMLQQAGLLRWHRAGARISRGILQLETLHFTATVSDTVSGTRFAVDSWFEANGSPPHVVPLSDWVAGWEPARPEAGHGTAAGRH